MCLSSKYKNWNSFICFFSLFCVQNVWGSRDPSTSESVFWVSISGHVGLWVWCSVLCWARWECLWSCPDKLHICSWNSTTCLPTHCKPPGRESQSLVVPASSFWTPILLEEVSDPFSVLLTMFLCPLSSILMKMCSYKRVWGPIQIPATKY